MKTFQVTSPRRIGRPLSFDRQTALEQAMLTFWRHGYETTSVVDLTSAMGITAPSLYAAFGDKKRLFVEAAHLYAGDPQTIARTIDDTPTALEAARTLLVAAATAFTGDLTPKGCLLASATASGSPASADVQRTVADIRGAVVARLRARIDRDVAAGFLPGGTDAAALSWLVMAVTQGMSVLARDGADRAALLAVVETALRAWPSRETTAKTEAGLLANDKEHSLGRPAVGGAETHGVEGVQEAP